MIRDSLLVLCLLIAISGCSMVKVKTSDCEATYSRFWYEQEGFTAKVCGGEAKVSKTTNDTEFLNAVLPLIAKGAMTPK